MVLIGRGRAQIWILRKKEEREIYNVVWVVWTVPINTTRKRRKIEEKWGKRTIKANMPQHSYTTIFINQLHLYIYTHTHIHIKYTHI